MNTHKLTGGFAAGLIAAGLIGCAPAAPASTAVPAPPPTATSAPTEVPADGLPPGVTVSSVTPQLPPTQIVGGAVGGGVAGTAVAVTAVVGPPLTSLPGGPPQMTPPITPQGNPADTPTVTLSDRGGTITIRVGQSFLLYLNQPGMEWMVSIEDESIVNRKKDVTLPEGAQGYFTGLRPGRTALMAVGDPPCRQSEPPCMMPSMLFQVEIVVQ